ncbi:MAG: glycosyltransferase family 4 protein [Dehalococcoidia bacterium]
MVSSKGGKNIRLLHMIHSPQRRGAEVFATQLARALEHDQFESTMCSLYRASHHDGLFTELADSFPLGAQQRGLRAKLGLQHTLLKLTDLLKRTDPNIVVAHGADTLKYAAFVRLFGHSPITIYRNIGMAGSWATSPWKTWGTRALLRGIDTVVSVSQATREDFIRVYGLSPGKIVTIPNGCDARPYQEPSAERNEMRRDLQMGEELAVLIAVGSLSPEKNHSQLLSLMAHLHGRRLASQLLLAGDGPLRARLEQQAHDLQVRQFVRFLGVREDVPWLLKAADILLLPSKTEGMPAVLIEAGLAGLPCVAYNVGGVREVVEPGVTGLLVSPGDSAGFEAAVVSLLEDRTKRQELGASARQRCLEHFSMDRVAKQYGELFLRLLKERERLGDGPT